MAMINLSSTNQDATDYTVTIPDGVKIPKDSQMCLVSYNGLLSTDPSTGTGTIASPKDVINFPVLLGVNDSFVVVRSDYDFKDNGANYGFQGHGALLVTVAPKLYSTLIELAAAVTDALNRAETDDTYKGSGNQYGRNILSGGTTYVTPGDGWICEPTADASGTSWGLTIRQRRRTQWRDTASGNIICPSGIAGTDGGQLGVSAPFSIPSASTISTVYYLKVNPIRTPMSTTIKKTTDGSPSPNVGSPGPMMSLVKEEMNRFRADEDSFGTDSILIEPDERVYIEDTDYKNLYQFSWNKPVYMGSTFNELDTAAGVPSRSGGLSQFGTEWRFFNSQTKMPDAGSGATNGGIFPGGSKERWDAAAPPVNVTPFPDWEDFTDWKPGDPDPSIDDDYLGKFNRVTVGLCPESWGAFKEGQVPIKEDDWALTGDEYCELPISVVLDRDGTSPAQWKVRTNGMVGGDRAVGVMTSSGTAIKYQPSATEIRIAITIDIAAQPAAPADLEGAYQFRCFVWQNIGGATVWEEIGNQADVNTKQTWKFNQPGPFTRVEDWYPVCKIHNPMGWGMINNITPEPDYGWGISKLQIQLNAMWKDAANIGALTGNVANSIFVANPNTLFDGRSRMGANFQLLPFGFSQKAITGDPSFSTAQNHYFDTAGWYQASDDHNENNFFTSLGMSTNSIAPISSDFVQYALLASGGGTANNVVQQSIFVPINLAASVSLAEPFYITCDLGSRTGHLATGDEAHPVTLLGQGHPQSNLFKQRFSDRMPTSAWVDLNNPSELTLNRINVRLVDEVNKPYLLLALFNCIVRFRQKSMKDRELDL